MRLRYTELGEIKSEMRTLKRVTEVHDSDRNDRDGAARAGDAVNDFPKVDVLVDILV